MTQRKTAINQVYKPISADIVKQQPIEERGSESLQLINSRSALAVLVLLAIFQLTHSLSLPLVITYDGHLYHELAKSLSLETIANGWADFVRTPVFPITITIFFNTFGDTGNTVLLVNTLVYTAAGLLLLTITPAGKARYLALALFAVSPIAVTYQHMFLTEVFLAFAVSIIACSLVTYNGSLRTCLGVTAAFSLAYYIKPSFLYFTIIFIALTSILAILPRIGLRLPFQLTNRWSRLVVFLTLSLITMLPWQYKLYQSDRMSTVKAIMCIKNLSVLSDFEMSPQACALYKQLLSDYSNGLPLSGVRDDSRVYEIVNLMTPDQKRKVLRHSYLANTYHTIKRAVASASSHFIGRSGENDVFVSAVFSAREGNQNKMYPGPEHLSIEVNHLYMQRAVHSRFANALLRLWDVYYYLHILALILIPILCWYVGMQKIPYFVFVLLAIIGVYSFMHAVGLLSINRYGFPLYGLLYFALCTLISVAISSAHRRLEPSVS